MLQNIILLQICKGAIRMLLSKYKRRGKENGKIDTYVFRQRYRKHHKREYAI